MATQHEQANRGKRKSGSKQTNSGSSPSRSRSGSGASARQEVDDAARPAPTEAKSGAQSEDVPSEDYEEEAQADAESDAESDAEEREGIETLVAMLVGMAQMDSEAAFAYEIAAEMVDLPDVRARLLEFAQDHRRHVSDIGQAIQAIGGEAAAAAPPPDTSVFGMLTSALGMVGPRAVLLGLIGNEEFTNSAYDTALELVGDPQLRQLIQRNFEDEQRHITWLATQARPAEDEEPLATGEN
jgi:rubrerythrin